MHNDRVRLFSRAKSLSNAQRERKLKREFTLTEQLDRFIFFTNMGREGAEHYKRRMRQKAMAKRLAEADGSGLTSKDAQKMINEAIEIQKKADASRAAVFAKPKSSYNPRRAPAKYTKASSRNNKTNDRRYSHPHNRNGRTPARGRSRPYVKTEPKGRKPRSGDTA